MNMLRPALALLAAGGAAAAGAQVQYPPGAVVQSLEDGAATRLAQHIRTLAASPRNLAALIGAGQAALEVGDIEAALAFFARAEEVSPRDGRVKAGMGSAFVQSEQPQAALKFFADAAALGADPMLFAKDRGLAYDMIGDQARAQADYTLLLARGPNAEAERRMALSKAIGGDRAGALALLEPQLRRQDKAAWRARAFVMALTGDVDEAERAVALAMPGSPAGQMRPFLERLPQLSAADRAMAVHFGRFPTQYASNSAARPVATPIVQPQPVPAQPRAASPVTMADRPDSGQPALGTRNVAGPPVAAGIRATELAPSAAAQPPVTIPIITRSGAAQPSAGVQTASPNVTPPAQPSAASVPTANTAAPPVSAPASSAIQFADVAAAIAALPEGDRQPAARPPAAKPAPAAAKPAAAKPAAVAPKEPSRIWVQLAAAQDKSAFPAEFRRIRAKAPDILGKMTAWTTPLRSTNRLLIGPFKTDKEARDLVNALSEKNISSYSWTSETGQAIEKLPSR